MENFVRENSWLPRDSFLDFGWGNGYVMIPKGHPLYGKHCDKIHELMPDLDVHGRLTFSKPAEELNWEEIPKDHKDTWIVGFDTAHRDDTLERWSKKAVIEETERLKTQLANYIA